MGNFIQKQINMSAYVFTRSTMDYYYGVESESTTVANIKRIQQSNNIRCNRYNLFTVLLQSFSVTYRRTCFVVAVCSSR